MSLHLGKAAAAENMPVDLELVLAVDISLSMDEDEQRLQRDGYVTAFRNPRSSRRSRPARMGKLRSPMSNGPARAFNALSSPGR